MLSFNQKSTWGVNLNPVMVHRYHESELHDAVDSQDEPQVQRVIVNKTTSGSIFLDQKNAQGETALYLAARKPKNCVIISLLLDAGAKVDTKVPGQQTALAAAVNCRFWENAELLVSRGAEPALQASFDGDAPPEYTSDELVQLEQLAALYEECAKEKARLEEAANQLLCIGCKTLVTGCYTSEVEMREASNGRAPCKLGCCGAIMCCSCYNGKCGCWRSKCDSCSEAFVTEATPLVPHRLPKCDLKAGQEGAALLTRYKHLGGTSRRVLGDGLSAVRVDTADAAADLGSGTFGQVYKALYGTVEVAVKCMLGGTVESCKKEAEIQNLVGHPNVVHLVKAIVTTHDDGSLRSAKFVMAYANGGSLWTAFRTRGGVLQRDRTLPGISRTLPQTGGGYLDYDVIAHICEDILCGLEHIHRCGVVLQDLKANNIVIHLHDNGSATFKICDFGAAVFAGQDIPRGTCRGTMIYQSPESIEMAVRVTPESDIFSFGILLNELLTGQFPGEDQPYVSDYEYERRVVVDGWRPDIFSGCALLQKVVTDCFQGDAALRPTASTLLKMFRHLRESKDWLAVLGKKECPTCLELTGGQCGNHPKFLKGFGLLEHLPPREATIVCQPKVPQKALPAIDIKREAAKYESGVVCSPRIAAGISGCNSPKAFFTLGDRKARVVARKGRLGGNA